MADNDDDKWPHEGDMDLAESQPWDRQSGEPTDAYGAFRLYRDLPATRRTFAAVAELEAVTFTERQLANFARKYDWQSRSEAWDDTCHQAEDRDRLEAIRTMHKRHRGAGALAVNKAIQALNLMSPEDISPAHAARFLALGAKLERETLIVSVEELQGFGDEEDEGDDPWSAIAAELSGGTDYAQVADAAAGS